jgi:selenocysteine-specific elongation factor
MRVATLPVIGHVNHGKTTLVRHLTGEDTDRTPEEKKRGMSIMLGFASLELEDCRINFIDCPGHSDFVRSMIAGLSGARGFILVVSSVTGPERQTDECLRIAAGLGLSEGLCIMTQADRATSCQLSSAIERTQRKLRDHALERTPLQVAPAGPERNLQPLHEALRELARRLPPPERLAGFMIPVDRHFSNPRTGVILAGTVIGAPVNTGEATLYPGGRTITLRGLQTNRKPVAFVPAGDRVALSVSGVRADELAIGSAVCAPDCFSPSRKMDVEITVCSERPTAMRHMDALRLFIGASSATVRLRLHGRKALDPGETACATLEAERPQLGYPGRRFILRSLSPDELVATGRILDPSPPDVRMSGEARSSFLNAVRTGAPQSIISAHMKRDGLALNVADVRRILPSFNVVELDGIIGPWVRLSDDLLAPTRVIEDICERYARQLAEAHCADPIAVAIPHRSPRSSFRNDTHPAVIAAAEARLHERGVTRPAPGGVRLVSHDPRRYLTDTQTGRIQALEHQYETNAFCPDDEAAPMDANLIAILLDEGRLIAVRNHSLRRTVLFHASAPQRACRRLADTFPPPACFTTGEARIALHTSRKFIVPLLEHMDAVGLTLRSGDERTLASATAASAP